MKQGHILAYESLCIMHTLVTLRFTEKIIGEKLYD